MNIVEQIKTEVAGHLNKPAIINGDQQVSYGELYEAVGKLANELRACGVRPTQRVALCYSDSIDYIAISLAILSLDAAIVPVFPSLSKDEVSSLVKRMKINYLISEKEISLQNSSYQSFFNCVSNKNIFLYYRLIKEDLPAEFYVLKPAFIRFSSGTTGANKGVVLSHESIIERTNAANKGLNISSSDVIIWVLSMSFHFVVTIILFLRRAATIVLCSAAFPIGLLNGLKNNKATFIYASPFHYHMLSHTDIFLPDMLSNIRLAISTATELPNSIADAFCRKFGFELSQAYGIIEVGLPFINLSSNNTKRDSAGTILPDYEIKIINFNSEKIGEICLRGKGMFDAYFSPWQERKQLLRDNWFNTKDLGSIDGDGFLYLAGRANSVINYCGMKIFPSEVESVLNQHTVIKESLVFGIPHPQYGQCVGARVVLQKGNDTKFDNNEVKNFCYKRLAPHKVPKEFECVSCLDKTLSGKLRRI